MQLSTPPSRNDREKDLDLPENDDGMLDAEHMRAVPRLHAGSVCCRLGLPDLR